MTDGAQSRAPDPVRLIAAAAGSAVAAGLAAVTATVFAIRALRPTNPGIDSPFYDMLLAGTLGGIILAGAVGFTLLAPITSLYRRAGLALVCAFATVIVMLVCIPVDVLLGRPGLGGLFLVCIAVAFVLGRRARRLAS